MSATTENRTMQEVQADYTKFCTLVGQAEYQIFTIKGDIENMKEKMRELNIEAANIKAASDAASVSEGSVNA